jgi:hypothetical protein
VYTEGGGLGILDFVMVESFEFLLTQGYEAKTLIIKERRNPPLAMQ